MRKMAERIKAMRKTNLLMQMPCSLTGAENAACFCTVLRLLIQFPASHHCQNKTNKIFKEDGLPTLLVKEGKENRGMEQSYYECHLT